jgi:hypothetical protein
MAEQPSIFDGADRTWVRDYLRPRYPELVAPYIEASRLYRNAKRRGAVTSSALKTLLTYARSPRTPLGENVASMLGELYDIDKSVATAIRQLATGRQVHERINSLVALDSCSTSSLHTELFALALGDRSTRVRELAEDKVRLHKLTGALTPNKSLERTREG